MASLPVQLAETVKNTGVKTVYGEPVDLDGVTIVPVAYVQFGFGGGEGGDDENQVASGGGGGSMNVPIGAYVRDRRGLRFEPNPVTLLAVGIPFLWVAGHALSLIIKAMKKKRR
jgi:hypothetical protein